MSYWNFFTDGLILVSTLLFGRWPVLGRYTVVPYSRIFLMMDFGVF